MDKNMQGNIIMMVPGTDGTNNATIQRIPLPGGQTEILEEEPLYVNAKQYQRILKRRQVRCLKFNAFQKLIFHY